MRAIQFWILFVGSMVIGGLITKQILLNREIDSQQRTLVDNAEDASDSDKYSDSWKELAVTVYANSQQDPPLAAVLKDENVGISMLDPDAASSNLPTPATNGASSKMPSSAPAP
jgi:hypothetical protein